MARLKIADVARHNDELASQLKKTQVAVGLISAWLLGLTAYTFLF